MRTLQSSLLLLLTSGLCAAADAGPANALTLPAVKDVRVTFYPSEAEFNGGISPRLRTSNIKINAGEAILMDFDRKELAGFLDKNKDKRFAAKLVLVSRGLHHGSTAKIEAAALDTASDWNEGDKSQTKAAKGEACFVAAQFETKPWTNAEGKEVANLRELLYDAKTDSIKTVLNSNTLTVKAGDAEKPVALELDAKFVEHLARAAECKGLVVFNRDRNMLADFYSREHDSNAAKLVLTLDDASAQAKAPEKK
jgi:hypothetical protein